MYSGETFSNADRGEIIAIFRSAYENPSRNDFPDFLCEGGYIEHFEVSATAEGKKGSKFKQETHVAEKERSEAIKRDEEAFQQKEREPHTLISKTYDWVYDNFSYDAFLHSLERNISKHCQAAKKFGTKSERSVFLIENAGGALCVYKNGRFKDFLPLHMDAKVLKILQIAAPWVRYCFYVSADKLEILDLSKIDELLKTARDDLDIRVGNYTDSHHLLFIDW